MNVQKNALLAQLKTLPPSRFASALPGLLTRLLHALHQEAQACPSFHSVVNGLQRDVIRLQCLENQRYLQQRQSTRENRLQASLQTARERLSLTAIAACLQHYYQELGHSPEASRYMPSLTPEEALEKQADLQQWQVRLSERVASLRETLARHQLQQALMRGEQYQQALAAFKVGVIRQSLEAKKAQDAAAQEVEKDQRDMAEFARWYAEGKYYQEYQLLMHDLEYARRELTQCAHAIVHIENVTLESICPDSEQALQWKAEFASLPLDQYMTCRDELTAKQAVKSVISASLNLVDNLTRHYFSLDSRLQDKQQRQKEQFFLALFEWKDWQEKKQKWEHELRSLDGKIPQYQRVPDTTSLIEKAATLPVSFDIDEKLLAHPRQLVKNISRDWHALEERARQNQQKWQLLGQLRAQWQQIEKIRQTYHFTQDDDFYRQQNLSLSVETLSETLAEQQRYLQVLPALIQQLQDYGAAKRDWQKATRAQADHVFRPALPLLERNISQLQAQMSADIQTLLQHSLVVSAFEGAAPQSCRTASLSGNRPSSCSSWPAILTGWQQDIAALTVGIPDGLHAWLHGLFQGMRRLPLSPQNRLQCLQLLHDIRQELQTAAEKPDYSLLLAYQNMAPQPAQALHALLSVKPDIPLPGTQDLPPLRHHPALQSALAALAAHCTEPPLSAHAVRVLEQARYHLHYLAWQREQDPQVPLTRQRLRFIADPLYQRLREHQGLARIWQLLLNAWCALLDRLQPDKEHRCQDRFFYRPTTAERLLDKAAAEVLCLA
ncbi:MAG: hypothetical protein JJT82_01400 [Legionellaceae bacterium]|nr:hypothetical protein [Legionellaceae bacterium]